MNRLCRAFSVLMLAGLSWASAQAAAPHPAKPPAPIDWPQFRFDDLHTGNQPFETTISAGNVKFLGPAWRAQLGDLVDFSSPTVVGGTAYIASSEGTLWAYPADGCGNSLCTTPLWHSTNLAQIIDTPTVANGVVYVGSQTDPGSNDGKLNAFAAAGCGHAACPPLWQGDAGTESILESSPTVANGVVYVGSFGHLLYAFNAEGCGNALCQPLWTGQTGGSIESTPTVYRNTVFIGSDDGKLYAFKTKGCRKSPCKPVWTGDLGGAPFESSPAVAKGILYIASQHTLSAFDARGCGANTCTALWTAVDNTNFFNGAPAVANGRVFIPLESGIAVYKAKGCGKSTCAKLWNLFGSGAQAAIVSSPTVANGVVYAGRNTGEVLAWPAAGCDSGTCSEIWKGFTDDPIVSSSPTVVNGKLYIGSADQHQPENISGRLYVFELTQ